jgi:hypothetical protein
MPFDEFVVQDIQRLGVSSHLLHMGLSAAKGAKHASGIGKS